MIMILNKNSSCIHNFFLACQNILYFVVWTCRISCTPTPKLELKKRKFWRCIQQKKCTIPPPPPPPPARFSGLVGIRAWIHNSGGKGKKCVPPPPKKKKKKQVPYAYAVHNCLLRLRLYLFCEGRISVLKRRFKTPIQNAVHGGTVYAYLEKKTISWACTAHAFTTLTEGGMSNGARAFSAFWIQAIVCSCTCLQRGTSSSSEPERRLYDAI